jgi:hypothetical protein
MKGGRWISYRGRLLTPDEYSKAKAQDSKRAGLHAPFVISDVMEDTLSHADGRHYSSKSKYYKSVKKAGCEIVGNDRSYMNPKPRKYETDSNDVKKDIKQAMDQFNSRRR